MAWNERWRAIAARIDGLARAGEYLLVSFQAHNNDLVSAVRTFILPELAAIREELQRFNDQHAQELPPTARDSLKRIVNWRNWPDEEARKKEGYAAGRLQLIAPLLVFRSEFDFLVRDTEVYARSLTELAFEHLRRIIAVDCQTKMKWEEAFRKHETRCEQLGAVHLLSHGIWAFKVSGGRSATDLVYQEPIASDDDLVRRTARAFVLTEWKLVRNPGELEKKAEEARLQTKDYAAGVLGDLELRTTRYIVLVTNQDLDEPQDLPSNGGTFRHIVVDVNPDAPSRRARRPARRRTSEGSTSGSAVAT